MCGGVFHPAPVFVAKRGNFRESCVAPGIGGVREGYKAYCASRGA
jgi:hypothetical protein